MKTVGIVPKANLFTTDFYNEDIYAFVNNYGKRITEAGALPAGIVPVDGWIREEQLENCDAFLFSGGGRILPYHMQVIEHAHKTGKKVLGICMGMQVIHAYFIVLDEMKRRGENVDINEFYDKMKKERYYFVEPVEHHWDINPTAEHMQEAKHKVTLSGASQLAELLRGDAAKANQSDDGDSDQSGQSGTGSLAKADIILNPVTMHKYRVTKTSKQLEVTAFAEDGTIEGLEFGRQFIGVQFHPEAEEEFPALFKWLAE